MNKPFDRFNHEQNANQRRRTPNNEIIPSPQDAVKKLPYGFVPIGDKINRKPAQDLNTDDEKLYTGYMNCSLYALNELCVGNSHKDLGQDKTEISPLEVNGKILIPSSTLKGCISNFMAAHLGLPITRMNNHHYSFRPNNAFSSDDKAKVLSAAGIVESLNSEDGSCVIRKFKTKKFAFTRDRIKDGDYEYNERNYKYEISPYGDKKGFFKIYDYHDGIDGSGTLARSFAGSRRCPSHKGFAVKVEDHDENPLSDELYMVSSETMKAYERTLNTLADSEIGHLNDHPLLDKDVSVLKNNILSHGKIRLGNIVFFEHAKDDINVLTLGKHFRYRWAFSRDLHSFDKDYLPYDLDSLKKGELNTIEELFGYSYGEDDVRDAVPFENQAKSAKVHFSYAEYVPGTGKLKEEKWLPRPGSPKPSSFEFYIKQNYVRFHSKDKADKDKPSEPLVTYGDPVRKDFINKPRLSGRKFYYKTATTPCNDSKEELGVDKTVLLRKVLLPSAESLPHFKFKVHYQNLSLTELCLLHFSLCLGQNVIPEVKTLHSNKDLLCHQIGYGKNYGMGAVKIVLDCNGGKEDILRVKNDPSSRILKLFRVKPTYSYNLSEAMKPLMLFSHECRQYPHFRGSIFQWHTKLKNDDLKVRIEKGRRYKHE